MIKHLIIISCVLVVLAASGCLSKSTPTVAKDPSGPLSVEDIRELLPGSEGGAYVEVTTDGQVNVTRKMKENLNTQMTLDGSRIDAIKILEAVFKDPRVSAVMIISSIPLVDKYGQTSQEVGTVFLMSRATYQKINWDNLLFSNLDDVSDKSYINPVLKE